jgi:hypothetical protein
VSYTCQWYRGSSKISGATDCSSYTLVAKDAGKKIKVKVTGSAVGYAAKSKTSKATSKVAKGTLASFGVPVIDITAPQVGQTLTTSVTNPPETTVKYQWYRGSKAIKGATKTSYGLVKSDLGKTIKVKVTVSRSGYNTVSKTSLVTAKVLAAALP